MGERYVATSKLKEIIEKVCAFDFGLGDEKVGEISGKIWLGAVDNAKEARGVLGQDFINDNVLQWHEDRLDVPEDGTEVLATVRFICGYDDREYTIVCSGSYEGGSWEFQEWIEHAAKVYDVTRWAYIPGTKSASGDFSTENAPSILEHGWCGIEATK